VKSEQVQRQVYIYTTFVYVYLTVRGILERLPDINFSVGQRVQASCDLSDLNLPDGHLEQTALVCDSMLHPALHLQSSTFVDAVESVPELCAQGLHITLVLTSSCDLYVATGQSMHVELFLQFIEYPRVLEGTHIELTPFGDAQTIVGSENLSHVHIQSELYSCR